MLEPGPEGNSLEVPKFRYVHLSPVSAAVLESWANEGGVMFNLHP